MVLARIIWGSSRAGHAVRTVTGINMMSLFPGGPSVDRLMHHTIWEGATVHMTLPPVHAMLLLSLPTGASDEEFDKFESMVLDLASKMAGATPSGGGAAGGASGSQA